MCGICGEINWRDKKLSIQNVLKMNRVLAPRGPDGPGVYAQSNYAFGHQRLKIFDLTEKSKQPMVDSDLGLVMVYNGAIYNYQALRQELQGLGYQFFSTGDSEILIKAYAAWGEDFVKRLDGMFAFALWDENKKSLLLGRDPLGIKPLYYSANSKSFRFASTLPALLAPKDLSTEFDPEALHHYFSFHGVVPAPKTLFKSIHKLPPASLMRVEEGKEPTIKKYWDLFEERKQYGLVQDLEEAKLKIHKSLKSAVQKRMIADVPVGVLLSGGLDSSLVVALLSKAGAKVKTFSIGFESLDKEKGDEFYYSDQVVKAFATDHQKIFIDSTHALDRLPACLRAMSEPMVSHDCIGFYLLSQKVVAHVPAVQSGQGADEVFGGYHWYPPLKDSHSALEDYRRLFFDRSHQEMGQLLAKAYYQEDCSTAFVKSFFEKSPVETPLEQALALDTQVMLVEDPVKRVDNMTMAWGLEARVPFLDKDLLGLAFRLDPSFKVGPTEKYVLKEIARDLLPSEVIDRPKGYFPVPAFKYLRGFTLDWVKEILSNERIKKRGFLQASTIEGWFKDPEAHLTPLRVSKLWQAAVLEAWLGEHL